MKRTIIKIDEEKCNGCGLCVSGCHEGALQLIEGKARMVSELYCDGLGACIGDCPVGAITLEEREAQPYDEVATLERMLPKGEKTILAHLKHLHDHNEQGFLMEAYDYLKKHGIQLGGNDLSTQQKTETMEHQHAGGCPGSKMMDFRKNSKNHSQPTSVSGESELRQWPVQLHLLNPAASYFQGADVLIAADCVAFAVGDFHSRWLKGKSLAIACPKLDSGKEIYIEKITAMIDQAKVNTLTVMIMEVPCCGGLLQIVKTALSAASRKVPVKLVTVGLQGDILNENWI